MFRARYFVILRVFFAIFGKKWQKMAKIAKKDKHAKITTNVLTKTMFLDLFEFS